LAAASLPQIRLIRRQCPAMLCSARNEESARFTFTFRGTKCVPTTIALCFQDLSFFLDVEYFSSDDFRFDLRHCACRNTGSLEDDPLKQIQSSSIRLVAVSNEYLSSLLVRPEWGYR